MTSIVPNVPQPPATNSLALNRGRRGPSKNSHHTNQSSSGQHNVQHSAVPMAPNAAVNSLVSGAPAITTNSGSGNSQVLPTSNFPHPGGGSSQQVAAQQISGGTSGLVGPPICSSGGVGSASPSGNPGLGSGSIGGGIPFGLSGAGATQPNPILTASQQPSGVQPIATTYNFNSYGKQYSASDPSVLPLLLPLDTDLRPRSNDIMVTQTHADPLTAIASLLRTYGLQPFKLKTATGDFVPDATLYGLLIDHLLAIRRGTSAVVGLPVDVQQQLFAMAGLTVKDSDPASLAQAVTRFTDRFTHTFESVATRPPTSWQGLQKDDIKALLGIIGFPFQQTAAKPALLDHVSLAQRLAVYQGRLIPQVLQPFPHVTLPDTALLDMATESFVGTLAVALVDITDPLPPSHDYKRFIQDFQGQTVDLSEFDLSLWSMLPSSIDRRIFLSMFGIPFEKTVALGADDLLPLLPRDLM